MNNAQKIVPEVNEGLEILASEIGGTPLKRIESLGKLTDSKLYAKLEWHQFGGSVKSRAAFNIICDAIRNNALSNGKRIVDASSGNTAIAYATIGARLGIGVTICIPENASVERMTILKALKAELVLTSPFGGTDEAQEKAVKMVEADPDAYFYANQYANKSNWMAHYIHTAEEIWDQTGGKITHFVCGLGTTGSITGISRKLKELNPQIEVIGLQPDSALHIMEGWKHLQSCRIPEIYDPFIIDQFLEVSSEETIDCLKYAANREGLLLSPSSAANLAGANKVIKNNKSAVVVTLFPDNGDKYLQNIQEWI